MRTASMDPGEIGKSGEASRPKHRCGVVWVEWLDDDGRFLFGKHVGERAEGVVKEDPEYVRWALEECVDMAEDDRGILEALATRAGI